MTTLATAPTNSTAADAWLVVRRYFDMGDDGWFYPLDSGVPLVRVLLAGDEFRVERRRKATAPWLLIVSTPVAEFDAGAFTTWAQHWQLTG